MEILKKGIMLDDTIIQIENWNNDYSFIPYGSTLGTYPKSKQTLEGSFSPTLNKEFRFQLDFNSYEEALEAFRLLSEGEKQLTDYKTRFKGSIEHLACV